MIIAGLIDEDKVSRDVLPCNPFEVVTWVRGFEPRLSIVVPTAFFVVDSPGLEPDSQAFQTRAITRPAHCPFSTDKGPQRRFARRWIYLWRAATTETPQRPRTFRFGASGGGCSHFEHSVLWSEWPDSNRQPRDPQSRALPDCATFRFCGDKNL